MDRRIRSSLKIGNIDKELAWLLPVLASEKRIKCQIFVLDKDTEDLVTGWLRRKCGELGMRYRMPSRKEICKLSGDNDREDKDRELSDFLCGNPQVLVSTDCAGMGVHVLDLRLVVNIGLPKNLWKIPQTFGRAGRDKTTQAATIQLHWPGQIGKATPASKVREIFAGVKCRRKAINDAFSLGSVHKTYEEPVDHHICLELGCQPKSLCR